MAEVSVRSTDSSTCIDKTGPCFRGLTLVICCALTTAWCICSDVPTNAADLMKERFNISTDQFAYIYSVYSLPNVVLPLVGAFL